MQEAQLEGIETTPSSGASCHGPAQADITGLPLLAIVGTPNVGKSVLFNTLTGIYVTVSNYPGTTVEVTRGNWRIEDLETGVMDTPGMYGLLPITEEERVARRILLTERPNLVVHVLDAKNVERMLPMTLQLIEAGQPVFLVVNLMDEADRLGIALDIPELERKLGIPVAATALAQGRGTKEMKAELAKALSKPALPLAGAPLPEVRYPQFVQSGLEQIEAQLDPVYPMSSRSMAVLLLENDPEVLELIRGKQPDRVAGIQAAVKSVQVQTRQPLNYIIARAYREAAQKILASVVDFPEQRATTFASRLSNAMIRPLTGLPILLVALFVLYEFVGVLGAQTLVNFLEKNVFGAIINPWIDFLLGKIIPWPVLRSLFGGQFGIITLGVRYAIAIVLPIVGTFFLAFSVIEDSGYLPRLAMLIDRVFKKIGLNGRAVIPMVLGFGCDTMATIVTRTLETKRERLLATILLSLAIPCSAQLGVMLGLFNGQIGMLAIWTGVIGGVFLLVGWLAAKLMPGERPTFYMELPPLRLPRLRNIFVKTYTRMEWYLREVFPLFILASVFIWFGRLVGLFDLLVAALVPMVRLIGLPDQTAVAFLFGFFRRDYGAAGLYDLRSSMTSAQVLVAATTMTLFMPCIAQFGVTVKERGWKVALGISAFIFPFALLVGGLLNLALKLSGWGA